MTVLAAFTLAISAMTLALVYLVGRMVDRRLAEIKKLLEKRQ